MSPVLTLIATVSVLSLVPVLALVGTFSVLSLLVLILLVVIIVRMVGWTTHRMPFGVVGAVLLVLLIVLLFGGNGSCC